MMFRQEVENQYGDIIRQKRPVSKRPKMQLQDRAKIFSPFAALTGHDAAIAAMQIIRVNKRLLSESEKEKINQVLMRLKKQDRIFCSYFVYDPGSDGAGNVAEGHYADAEGCVTLIDLIGKKIRICAEEGDVDISIDDIQEIRWIRVQ